MTSWTSSNEYHNTDYLNLRTTAVYEHMKSVAILDSSYQGSWSGVDS